MPWFRFLKKQKSREAGLPAETEVEPPVSEPEDEIEEETSDSPDGVPRKRRRRGSRGGRNRRKAVAGDGAEETADTPGDGRRPVSRERGARSDRADKADGPGKSEKADKPEKAERGERSQRRSRNAQGRRRQPPRRAPLPAAKRELLISVDIGEQRVAVVEDDKVVEVYLERPDRRSIAGNIYVGAVDNVLPGMEAAFVEIGLEKNGFLYVDEIVVPELEGKRHGKKITDLIQRGQTILVQAVKDPMKTKGARLTTEISLPGRFLVYVPQGEGLGVSRRLEEAERTRLKDILKGLDITEGGVIVRTAAEGASAEDVERDFVFLQRLWKTIQVREKAAKAPELIYQEAELPLRIVRDLFAGGFEAAYVDNDRAHKRIVGYLKKTSPAMIERVHRHKEKEPLFERFGVEKEIASTLDRRVDLPSGGYLIFDYAEAFTVVDVNTGRFVGSRSKTSTQRLEDTIVKNNLEAVKEVVRQLRLRDIGGIIVIDFIDMANPKNRQAVEEALRQELERDRTKTYVVEISPLGLVEMTRQNVTDGPREVMTRKCPTCAGDGIVVSDATSAMKVERELRSLATAGARGVQAFRVAVHPRILPLLAGRGGERLRALEEATKRRFFLVDAEGHAHADHCQVLAEGKTEDLQPQTALAAGSEVDVKLVEVGLHDPTAAVGTADGVEVVVADAASLVGRKVKAVVGLALEGRVFGTVVGGPAAPTPITFESEAEKPTRAPAKRKTVEVVQEPEEAAAVEAPGDVVEGVAEAEEAEETETAEEAGGETAARKRTRRGSRGGRGRRRPAGTAVEGEAEEAGPAAAPLAPGEAPDLPEPSPDAEGAAEAEAPSEPAEPRPRRRRAPKIHVPDGGRTTTEAVTAKEESAVPDAPPDVVEAGAPDEQTEVEGEPDGPEAGDEPVTGAPRKRTRRGSRGGRGRRKPAGAAATAGEAGDEHLEPALEDEVELPDAAEKPTVVEEPTAPAVAAAADGGEHDGRPAGESAVDEEPAEDGSSEAYVPMSQWIQDFDRR